MRDIIKKKVLICSIPSWNKKSGADTYTQLFEGCDISKLACLYIREDNPDSDVCNLYFRISENKIIKSLFNHRIQTGEKIEINKIDSLPDNSKNEFISKRRYRRFLHFRPWSLVLLRELIWFCGHWKTKELDDFITDFKPDIVLFAMEGYIHFDRICRYIISRSHAVGIGYFWDDNFTYKKFYWNPLEWLNRFLQRNELIKCVKCCKRFLAITSKTKKEADKTFNINCEIITKPVKLNSELPVKNLSKHFPIRMIYTGNLIYGRFETLKIMSDCLKEINNSNNIYFVLDVYTGTDLTEKEKNSLLPYVNIRGFVNQDKILEIQEASDILVFIEALCGRHAQDARLSFSTKITDYLSANKCILAIGPNNIAPIEYLQAENAAIVATNKDEIKEKLISITNKYELLSKYAMNARECASRNHLSDNIKSKLYSIINSI